MIPSRVLLRDGTRIALTTWSGTAPRIVALHGLGQLGAAWSAFASAVDRRAEVVAIDLRGHGDSDDDPSGAYLLATFVRDVVELLESTSPEPPVLIGHSLGGRIALEIAARDLTPIAAAVVVDASPTPPAATLAHLEEHFAAAPLRATSAASYADHLATLHPLASREALRPLIEALRTLPDGSVEERVDPRALRSWSAGLLREPWPKERSGAAPLALVRGLASSMLTRQVATNLADGQFVDALFEITRAGHDVLLDNPDALAEVTVDYLRSLRRVA